jgi:hypothetical protein
MRNHTNNILSEMSDVRRVAPPSGIDAHHDEVNHEVGWQASERASFDSDAVSLPIADSRELLGTDEYGADLVPGRDVAMAAASQYVHRDVISARSSKRGVHITRPFRWLGVILLLVAIGFAGREIFSLKGRVLGESEVGYRSLSMAVASLRMGDLSRSNQDFETAYTAFSAAWKQLGVWRLGALDIFRYIPFLSQFSSGKNVIEAGRHIARAGQILNGTFSDFSFSAGALSKQDLSFLDVLHAGGDPIREALPELRSAMNDLDQVRTDDIPEEKRASFNQAKKMLPTVIAAAQSFLDRQALLSDALGGNGPRKYLFLFQNNHEIRPTGGFIGSYGLLEMKDGKIRKFFVNGIFDPDGQLKEKIIPPVPLQKVSAAWSLHDSNWSPDFPTAARKAMYFYEKTGGPSVDGVIALTPDIVRDLVGIFGPIEMPEYGVTLTKDNFVEAVQEEVEVKYDREGNQPKKILSDLAPILLGKIFSTRDPKVLFAVFDALTNRLNQKDILLFARDDVAEADIEKLGWSGKLEDTPLDYLSVIDTNINGYKTDAVVRESISHEADIHDDGSVVDIVRITRKHEGGRTRYEWWNKVNADYMRVFVPQGSELLSVSGQTREIVRPSVDYAALGFATDPDIAAEERAVKIDEKSGTRIGSESGKTTFGNWVYVSPGESVTVEYRYRLPSRVIAGDFASYAMLFQKQPGSRGSDLTSTIVAPSAFQLQWQTGEYEKKNSLLSFQSVLSRNLFLGAVWSIEGGNE